MEVTSEVAQGSILRPDLWNASYDSLLKLDMPEELRLVGYPDDVLVLVAGYTVEQAQSRHDWSWFEHYSAWKHNSDPAFHIDRRVNN